MDNNIIKIISLLSVIYFISSCTSVPKIQSESGRECENLPLFVKWSPAKPVTDTDNILRITKGYKLYVKPTESKTFSQYINVGDVNQYKIDHLQKGKSYDLKVVAYNENGESKPSKAVSRKICE